MRVLFSTHGWEDYLYWCNQGGVALERINALIEDTRRHPFRGIGKPEPLKGKELRGRWSRRITDVHRMVYAIEGKGDEQRIFILQCRYHY